MKCFLSSIPLAASLVPALITSHLGCGSHLSTGCSVSLLSRHSLLPSLPPDGLPRVSLSSTGPCLNALAASSLTEIKVRNLEFSFQATMRHLPDYIVRSLTFPKPLLICSVLPTPPCDRVLLRNPGWLQTHSNPSCLSVLSAGIVMCRHKQLSLPSCSALHILLLTSSIAMPSHLLRLDRHSPSSVFSTPHHLTAPNSHLFSYITLPQIILAWSRIWHCRMISYVPKCAMLFLLQ